MNQFNGCPGCGIAYTLLASGAGPHDFGACAARKEFAAREQAIRADERAKVAAEIVAWLKSRCSYYDDKLADTIERDENPKPGQPKEGEHE